MRYTNDLQKIAALSLLTVFIAGAAFACQPATAASPAPTSQQTQRASTDYNPWAGFVTIKYIAHSCFLITSANGTSIIIDPYTTSKDLDYSPVNSASDIVLISDDASDDNNVSAVSGKPEVMRETGARTIKGIYFEGLPSFHDNTGGSQRGSNTIFVFEINGVRFCHLGDLGHTLSPEMISKIG
jgi:L-ascorbate metabolism protein UlaG (beta-lactamase superfamily)